MEVGGGVHIDDRNAPNDVCTLLPEVPEEKVSLLLVIL